MPVYLADPGINGIHKTRPDGSQVTKYDAPKATLMSYIIKGILNRQLPWGLVLLGVMIAIVLILEGLNTALEAAVDLASPRIHPLAKSAKDLAAGMVLIAALASIAVGLLILGPPLLDKLRHSQ